MPVSVNQRLPSPAATMPWGSELKVTPGYSVIVWLIGLIEPSPPPDAPLPLSSVNQRLPSGPVVMPCGCALAVASSGNSVTAPVLRLMTAIWLAVVSTNQRLPSGPGVISLAPEFKVGIGYCVLTWVVGL